MNSDDQLEGTRRLVCSPKPAYQDVGSPVTNLYRFNALIHNDATNRNVHDDAAVPSTRVFTSIGTSDFSLEYWFKYFPDGQNPAYRDDSANRYPNGVICGYTFSTQRFGVGFDTASTMICFGTGADPPNTVYKATGTPPDDGDWHHWCGNFDRSGFATLYIDGISNCSVDISAEVANNMNITTRIVGQNLQDPSLGADERATGFASMAAFHRTLLTLDQISSSVYGRRVQNLTNTDFAFDFGRYVLLDEDYIDFTTVGLDVAADTPHGWTRAIRRPRRASLSPNCLVLDQSASGNDWNILGPTAFNFSIVTMDPSWK